MNTKFEKINDNTAKITITVENDLFLKSEDTVYSKKKNKFNIPGFRKGHATKDMIFKVYGRGIFFEDAADDCINNTYYDAVKDIKEAKVISRPNIEVTQIGEKEDFVYIATVAIEPEFKLAKYKGVEIDKVKREVSDDDLKARLLVEQNKNARLVTVDREIKNDDIVTIDFVGSVDGVKFKGGEAKGYELTIGSHSFIDNFEEQLIGHKSEDDVDVNVTFPSNYMDSNLAGKKALFKVKIHEIKVKEVPELNDEFASDVSEFNTLEEFKNDIKKKMLEEVDKNAISQEKQKLIEKIVKDTDINLSEQAIEQSIDDNIRSIENRMYYQKMSLSNYLQATGQTMEKFRESQKESSINNLKTSLILDKIAKTENIEASDEMLEKEIEGLAKSYRMDVDKFKSTYINDEEKQRMKEDLKFPAVVDFIYENAKLK